MKAKAILEKKDISAPEINLTKTLIFILVGLVLLLIPDTLNKIIGFIVGGGLLLIGLSNIYNYLKTKIGGITLTIGILYSVLGCIIIIYPHSVLRLIAICIGVYLLINSLLKIQRALLIKDSTNKWIGTLVVGIIFLILGILLIFNPFSGIAITKLTGAFLVAMSVFDLIDVYLIQKK